MKLLQILRQTVFTFDIVCALCVLCISSGLTAFAYAKVRSLEAPSIAPIFEFKPGINHFSILAGNECVGKVVATLKDADSKALSLQANLNGRYSGNQFRSSVIFNAQFNPLNQLIASDTKILSQQLEVTMTTENIHPLLVHLTGSVIGSNLNYSISLPGPVQLVENHTRRFALTNASWSHAPSALLTPFLKGVLEKLRLHLVTATEEEQGCNASVNLEEVITPLLGLASNFQMPVTQGTLP